jgi:predicted ATPase/DNA-binding SARP family transcriptional activator
MAGGSAEVEFRVLGGVEALRNGRALTLGGPRQRALLALLLIADGKPVTADRLIDELWHGEPPAGAAGTLQSYVSRLRSALAADGGIVGSAAGYALTAADPSVDTRPFERLVDEGQAALERNAPLRAVERFDAALALWRGTPFSGVDDEGALRAEADRLADVRLRGREGRMAARLELGGSEELIDELESLVAEHPYRERLWHHLMLALYRAGRQADALAAYRRAREILDQELGLDPSEELRALEQAILRHEVPLARPPEERHNLPAPLTSFIGREQELTEISSLFDQTRLLTLTGVGGVGKTRLALEAARRALPDFSDGVYFVDFSSLTDRDLVPRHVARTVDVGESGDTDIRQLLVARLHGMDVLLVLDNCEHLREACARLAHDLLSAAPHLRIVATSRELLGASGEVDYPVPPLASPEAVELFLLRVRAARAQFSVDDRAVTTAAGICAELDGLPLALELAAARAKVLSLEEIASRLSDRFRFLVSWRRLTQARHRTLRVAMDWSYELLSPEQQTLLARLSVFAGGFTLAAAAQVCVEGDEEQTLDLLEGLVNASLVVAEEGKDGMRYRMLETVRQYAAARLDETGFADSVCDAHAQFFLRLAKDPYDVKAEEVAQYLDQLTAEHDNLRAAFGRLEAVGDGAAELGLAARLWRFWYVRGHLAEGRGRLEAALSRQAGDESTRARALTGVAGIAWSQDDLAAADRYADQGLALARRNRLGGIEFTALTVRVSAAIARGELELARQLCYEAEEAARQWFPDGLALMRNHRGTIAQLQGRHDEAEKLFEEGLAHARTLGNIEIEAFALEGLAHVTLAQANPEQARSLLVEALGLFERLGFKLKVVECLDGLAAAARDLGDLLRAATLLGTADALADELGRGRSLGPERDFHADLEAGLRNELGADTFERARSGGRQTPLDAALRQLT